jgi:hypothetical protein
VDRFFKNTIIRNIAFTVLVITAIYYVLLATGLLGEAKSIQVPHV